MKDTPGDKITIRVGHDLTGTVIAGSRNTYVNNADPREAGPVQVNTAHDNSTMYVVQRGEQHVLEVPEPGEPAT